MCGMTMKQDRIRRVRYGHFVRPSSETGTGAPRVEPLLGYAVLHDDGVILFDTGMAEADPETEAHYKPHRRDLAEALRDARLDLEDVKVIANSHLHFDHCGGNQLFPHRPIVVQRIELAKAREPDYTIPSAIDYEGATYEELDGEAEIMAGVWLIPTPGHTEGHQSLVVVCSDGTVVCAGQTHLFSFEFGSELLADEAYRMSTTVDLPKRPMWLDRLKEFDPRRVVFAHDLSALEL
jgi:N-acyl homoserine lactone hydrolase